MRIGILLLVVFVASCCATDTAIRCKKEVVCSPLVYDLKTGKHHLYCFPVVVCSYGGKEFYLEAGEYIAIRSASGYSVASDLMNCFKFLKKEIEEIVNHWAKELTTPGSACCCISKSSDLKNRDDLQAVDMWLFKRSLKILIARLKEKLCQ
ncbi:MAG: hypothetical protein B6D55_04635 [Candidatus Omnitrophica bacterium 4484_70.2]|nr:MAG: hypothetical protein B6D55_04635 [Candidatus Omnitrophica bacterium 4484_70.2]